MTLSDFDRGPSWWSWSPRRVLGWVAVVGSLAGLWLAASWLNHRRYHLFVSLEQARVHRGAFLPLGHRPFVPEADALRRGYAPARLPEGLATSVGDRVFTDRVKLDQALFLLLFDAARFVLRTRRVTSEGAAPDPRDLDLAAELVAQLGALPGVTRAQLARVRELERELDYFRARDAIRAAEGDILEAHRRLLGARGGARVPEDAMAWARRAHAALGALSGDVAADRSGSGMAAAAAQRADAPTAPRREAQVIATATAARTSTRAVAGTSTRAAGERSSGEAER